MSAKTPAREMRTHRMTFPAGAVRTSRVWNRDTHEYIDTYNKDEITVVVCIDEPRIVHRLAMQAAMNSSGKAQEMSGLVYAKVAR